MRFFICFLTFFKHHSKSLKKSPTIRNNVNIRWNVHLKKRIFFHFTHLDKRKVIHNIFVNFNKKVLCLRLNEILLFQRHTLYLYL